MAAFSKACFRQSAAHFAAQFAAHALARVGRSC